MTSLEGLHKEDFIRQLEAHFAEIDTCGKEDRIRLKAWDQFLEIGLPSKHMEVWRYIKLRKLYSQSLSPAKKADVEIKSLRRRIPTSPGVGKVVFINGHFFPEFSEIGMPGKVAVLNLEQAVKIYGAFLNNHLAKSMKRETDPFVSLNGALFGSGAFLYIPPRTVLEEPIQVLNLVDNSGPPMMVSPRLHVFAGAQSEARFSIVNTSLAGEGYFSNQLLDLVIEEGARLHLDQITLGAPKSGWIFDAIRAILKRDSSLKTVSVTEGAATMRCDYHIQLAGENCEASLNGLWSLDEEREAHANVLIDHQAPNCRSLQLFKGVLNDKSASSFEGKILVRQAAQKTDAFQLNNNLLLSDRANADSKPNLEIFADDVKASHGATVGQLDKDQLFYLRARGISREKAQRILVRGYCKEVIDQLRSETLRNEVETHLAISYTQ